MAIFETFSKRKKRLRDAGKEDVYQYDSFPEAFRIQVIHIWRSTIGRYDLRISGYEVNSPARGCWNTIHDTLARENGQFFLGHPNDDPDKRCQTFLMTCSADEVLDILELSFKVIDGSVRSGDYQSRARTTQSANEAIDELNHRFREHGIGYQYVDGMLVRVDSQFVHDQAVKPALALLHEAGFQGPSDEFISAFDKHKKGDSKGAIADALKAFESKMKAICDAQKWTRAA